MKNNYLETQSKWAQENDIKKGSKVKVTREAADYENGWKNTWCLPEMTDAVGNVLEVLYIDKDWGVVLNDHLELRYPYFVLEPVNNNDNE